MLDKTPIDSNEVEEMQKGNITETIKNYFDQINEMLTGVIDSAGEGCYNYAKMESSVRGKRIENEIAPAQKKIVKKAEEVKESVRSNSVAGNIMKEFTMPEFPASLSKLSSSLNGFDVDIHDKLFEIAGDSKKYIKETRTRERESRGLWEGFCSWFGEKYYEDYEVTVVKADVEKFRAKLGDFLEDYINDNIKSAYENLEEETIDCIFEIYRDICRQCNEIQSSYKAILDTFAEDVNTALLETGEHKKAIEHDIKVLEDIKTNIVPFFDLWNQILRK